MRGEGERRVWEGGCSGVQSGKGVDEEERREKDQEEPHTHMLN